MENTSIPTSGFLEVMYGGIDMTLNEGEGGAECAAESSLRARAIETMIVSSLSILQFTIAKSHCSSQNAILETHEDRIVGSSRRRFLLVALTMVFGMEIAFKLVTKKVIFLLNPCHIITVMQIYFLAGEPTPTMHFLFQAQVPILFGPLLAMILPDTATRYLPLERETYWVQHFLIYIIPAYLVPLGGVYRIEPNWCWMWMSLGASQLYHSILLQLMSVLTSVNLNWMLCAHSVDPFKDFNYRIWGNVYCLLLCWTHSYFYTTISKGVKGLSSYEDRIVSKGKKEL